MSLHLLTSAGHSPGVTSLAVALATVQPSLLVDANREPDQAILAGFLQGLDAGGRGLGGLLQAHREHRSLVEAAPSQLLPLTSESDLLPGFAHPGMVSLFAPVWPGLTKLLVASTRPVVVDLGRISPAGLPEPLVTASTGVLVVTGSRLPDLAALRLYLPLVLANADQQRVGLVVIGPNRPYGVDEIAKQFDLPVWGKVAWRPDEAAAFATGEAVPRQRGAYLADVRELAKDLAGRAASRRHALDQRPPRTEG